MGEGCSTIVVTSIYRLARVIRLEKTGGGKHLLYLR